MQWDGIDSFIDQIKVEVTKLEAQGVQEVQLAARVLQDGLFSRTPVWSGETIRNYAWGFNGAPSGGHRDPIGGDPGHTGFMALGSEPNRAANETAVRSEMEGVLSGLTGLRTLSALTVTNFGEIWDLVDNGGAPTADRARNPGGVSLLAEQSARSQLVHFR